MAETVKTVTAEHPSPAGDGHRATALFVVLDAARPLSGGARAGLDGVTEALLGRGPRRAIERAPGEGGERLAVHLADPLVSSAHARLSRVLGEWVLEDLGSKNGTRLAGERVVGRAVVRDRDLIELGSSFVVFRDALETGGALADRDLAAPEDGGGPTLLPAWEAELERLDTVARGGTAVLLQGESGTGKELLAARVHRASGRAGALVAVNCAGLTDSLLTAQLFGHKKGAFSGAEADSPGLVRAADRGTLFLDEVGDLPPAGQAALLRVLQEHEVLPVGATRPVPVDLRVVSATHRDLRVAVDEGRFRADLRARLAGFCLELPPLRERREDLGLLVGALLSRLGDAGRRVRFENPAAAALLGHRWPLNVRELEQALSAAASLARGGLVTRADLPGTLALPPARPPPPEALSAEDVELRAQLDALLREHRGNLAAVARAMGKARTQLHRWLRRFRLDAGDYRR